MISVRERPRRCGATIPVGADRAANRRRRGGAGGGPPAFEPYAVERGFDRPRRNRGPAAGYGKLAVRYRATTRIAVVGHRLERLA